MLTVRRDSGDSSDGWSRGLCDGSYVLLRFVTGQSTGHLGIASPVTTPVASVTEGRNNQRPVSA